MKRINLRDREGDMTTGDYNALFCLEKPNGEERAKPFFGKRSGLLRVSTEITNEADLEIKVCTSEGRCAYASKQRVYIEKRGFAPGEYPICEWVCQ